MPYSTLIASLQSEVDSHKPGTKAWLDAENLVGRAQTVQRFYKEFVASEDLQEILDIIIVSDDSMEIISQQKVAEFIQLNGGAMGGSTLARVMKAWRTETDIESELFCPLRVKLDEIKVSQKEQLGCFNEKLVKFTWAALYGQRDLDRSQGGQTEYQSFGSVARSIRSMLLGDAA